MTLALKFGIDVSRQRQNFTPRKHAITFRNAGKHVRKKIAHTLDHFHMA
jgi:hypothetical protein